METPYVHPPLIKKTQSGHIVALSIVLSMPSFRTKPQTLKSRAGYIFFSTSQFSAKLFSCIRYCFAFSCLFPMILRPYTRKWSCCSACCRGPPQSPARRLCSATSVERCMERGGGGGFAELCVIKLFNQMNSTENLFAKNNNLMPWLHQPYVPNPMYDEQFTCQHGCEP